jgi:hypothetical protein
MIIVVILLAYIDRISFLRSFVGSQFIWTIQNELVDTFDVRRKEESWKSIIIQSHNSNSVVYLSFEDAVNIIKHETPKEFLQAVKKSGGKFLYRGEDMNYNYVESTRNSGSDSISVRNCVWMNPEPDLLLPGTYSDDNALKYFQSLENCLDTNNEIVVTAKEGKTCTNNNIARPSNAHIATPNIVEARKWGESVSIWPCGQNFAYCFPKNRNEFYNENMDVKIIQHAPINCADEISINRNLSTALFKGKEVMFSSTDELGNSLSAFIAIPSRFDNHVRTALCL